MTEKFELSGLHCANCGEKIRAACEKLDGVSDKWVLKTVWGVGYKFELL